jgi:D-hexose-6-phosphate mutarotase
MSQIDDLNSKYGQVDDVRFCLSNEIYAGYEEALPVMVVENKLAKLVMALNGAHIMSYVPAGGEDMFWLSPKSRLAEGVPVRGGIPLCTPWFGVHPDGLPMHGFARIMNWNVDQIENMENGATKVVLSLSDTPSTRSMWPHAFAMHFDVVVGSKLQLDLAITNHSQTPAHFECAFHTYFNVGDVKNTTVEGLDGCTYIDMGHGKVQKQQQGSVMVDGIIQNLYVDVSPIQFVKSPAGNYKIEGSGHCALVWNCGDNDRNVPDIGAGNHKGYLCVERVDAAEWAVNIEPGESYATVMILSRE